MFDLPEETELQKIRKSYQSSNMYLSVFQPKILAQAQLNAAAVYVDGIEVFPGLGSNILELNFFVTGSLANGVREGQTVYVGTSPGGDEKGRVRFIAQTGTMAIKVALDKSIHYQVGDWITIREFYEIWPVIPNVILDEDNKTTTFFKDLDIAYTNQNEIFDPIVCCGYHYAGFENSIFFTATGTRVIDGSIDRIVWQFPTGSIIVANPGALIFTGTTVGIVRLPKGYNTVYCTAYTTQNKSRTAKRHYTIHDRFGEGPLTPISDWKLLELTGNWGEGWYARIEVGKDAHLFRNGYLVTIFAEDYYGEEKINLGARDSSETIYFNGYVSQADTFYNPYTNKTEFKIKGTILTLKNRPMFSVTLEHSNSPTDWTQIKNMNLNKILFHYLRWHTTLLDVADYYDLRTIHGGFPDQFEDIPKNELATNISSITERVFAKVVSNKQGQISTEVDFNMLQTGTRQRTWFSFLDTDWVGNPQVSERLEPPVSDVLGGGVAFNDVLGTGSAFLSRAPGLNPGISHFGQTESFDGKNIMPTGSQQWINEITGLYFAKANNPYPSFVMETANNFKDIDVIPQRFYEYDISAETTFRKIVWLKKRLIPRRVDIKYLNNKITQIIEFEPETHGPPGETYIIPTEPIDGGGPEEEVPPPEENVPQYGGRQTWASDSRHLGYTDNLLSTSPNWREKTGNISGEIVDFILDPYDPTNTAYCLTRNAVWKTLNASSNNPLWIIVLDISTHFAANLSPQFTRIKATIARRGRIYVLGYAKLNSGDTNYRQYVWATSNGGSSWIRTWTGNNVAPLGTFFSHTFTFTTGLEGWVWAHTPPNVLSHDASFGNPAGSLRHATQGTGHSWGISRYYIPGSVQANTGESFTFQYYHTSPPLTCFAAAYIGYKDGTQDSPGSAGTSGGSWNNWFHNPTVSAPNNGKVIDYIQILTGNCFDLANFWIDNVQVNFAGKGVFGTTAILNGAFDVGQHNPDMVYVSDGNTIRRSTNGAVSFSVYINTLGAYDLECPYAGNPTDNNILFWSPGGNLYRTNGSSPGSPILSETAPSFGHRRIVTYVQDANIIYVLKSDIGQKRVARTFNAGATWEQYNVTGEYHIGLWPYDHRRVFLLSQNDILYSANGGSSFSVKDGDWSTVMAESFGNGGKGTMIVPNWTITE